MFVSTFISNFNHISKVIDVIMKLHIKMYSSPV